MRLYDTSGDAVSFAKKLDDLFAAPAEANPNAPKCDSCWRTARSYYKVQPRNTFQKPEYHAYCERHNDPLGGSSDEISFEEYVTGLIHES